MNALRALLFALCLATAPVTAADLVDLNTATVQELTQLPNIGPSRAQDIVDYREANGPFATVEDLDKVKGIGPKILDGVRSLVTVTTPEVPAAVSVPAVPGVGVPAVPSVSVPSVPGVGVPSVPSVGVPSVPGVSVPSEVTLPKVPATK